MQRIAVHAAILFLAMALVLGAQSSVAVESTTDVNGNRVVGSVTTNTSTATSSVSTQRIQSANGQMVPRERVEEHVLRDDANGRIVERTVVPYDQNGQPGPPVKTRIEEEKHGNQSTIRTTTYKGDINGSMNLAERSVTDVSKSGDSQTANTVVERPTINGSLELVEKVSEDKTTTGNSYQESTVTYRKGQDGFYPAKRIVTSHSDSGNQSSDNTAEYEVGSSGTLQLHSQTVTHVVKNADGSQTSEVDRFGASVPGTVRDPDSALELTERDVVSRKATSSGVVETMTAQRPTISNPHTLGPPKVISETVCQGKCN